LADWARAEVNTHVGASWQRGSKGSEIVDYTRLTAAKTPRMPTNNGRFFAKKR
jgi:hypothetical protein